MTSTKLLGVYLNDHPGGATAGMELAEKLRSKNEGTPLGTVLVTLVEEIKQDRVTLPVCGRPCCVAAGSGRLGEHLVQDAAALLRQGHEAAVVAGESTMVVPSWSASATAVRLASCPLDVVPPATTMRVDGDRCPPTSPINSPVWWRRTGAVTRWRCGCAPPCG